MYKYFVLFLSTDTVFAFLLCYCYNFCHNNIYYVHAHPRYLRAVASAIVARRWMFRRTVLRTKPLRQQAAPPLPSVSHQALEDHYVRSITDRSRTLASMYIYWCAWYHDNLVFLTASHIRMPVCQCCVDVSVGEMSTHLVNEMSVRQWNWASSLLDLVKPWSHCRYERKSLSAHLVTHDTDPLMLCIVGQICTRTSWRCDW